MAKRTWLLATALLLSGVFLPSTMPSPVEAFMELPNLRLIGGPIDFDGVVVPVLDADRCQQAHFALGAADAAGDLLSDQERFNLMRVLGTDDCQ